MYFHPVVFLKSIQWWYIYWGIAAERKFNDEGWKVMRGKGLHACLGKKSPLNSWGVGKIIMAFCKNCPGCPIVCIVPCLPPSAPGSGRDNDDLSIMDTPSGDRWIRSRTFARVNWYSRTCGNVSRISLSHWMRSTSDLATWPNVAHQLLENPVVSRLRSCRLCCF